MQQLDAFDLLLSRTRYGMALMLADGNELMLPLASVSEVFAFPEGGLLPFMLQTVEAALAGGRKVIYLDGEGSFYGSSRETIDYRRIFGLLDLLACLHLLEVSEERNFLLVIDSLACLLRPLDCSVKQRLSFIFKTLGMCHSIVQATQSICLVTNQMTTKQSGVEVPSLGSFAGQMFTHRMHLTAGCKLSLIKR